MLHSLVILGAGGFARETLDVIDAINELIPTWEMIGFIIDEEYGKAGDRVDGMPVLGGFDWLEKNPSMTVVCGVGAPEFRYRMIKRTENLNVHFATLIHPSVIKTRKILIGSGSIITAGVVLSNNIEIHNHVHINPSCTIGHDVKVESFASLAPGVLVSGNVHICEGAYIGTGARIIEKKVIGPWSITGAGATVIKSVPANSTVVGTPAKVIKERPADWHFHDED